MKVYRALSRLFPRSYSAKLLAVVLVCIALPMLALVLWLLWNNGIAPEGLIMGVSVGLAATLTGTLVALLLLYRLLDPLRRAADALDAYYVDQRLPALPEIGGDEIGRLMRGINRCLCGIDAALRDLERHALQDPLTGAMNRRGCEQALAAAVARSDGIDRPFVLFVIDLDNLKPINDEYGHSAGDRALMTLVDSAAECCLGAEDWIGRWGGDEFLLGIHDGLSSATDRVAAWLKVLSSPTEGRVPVRVSAGCAHYQPGQDPWQLYRQADRAMYEAKFSGGNKLVCHSTLPDPTAKPIAA